MKCILICLFNFLLLSTTFCQYAEPDASIWVDPWVSCKKKPGPKSEYGKSHWIQYDFGEELNLSKSRIWNVNDPDKLNQGFKQVKIDYSSDGQNWTHFGEMTFPKASGEAVYGGFAGPDLVSVSARYLLLTAISNHGHRKCTGLTEVKFNLLPTRAGSTYEEEDGDDDEDDENKCEMSGTVFLMDGNKVELNEFVPRQHYRHGFVIETKNGWRNFAFDKIDEVYIRHVEGNKFNYEVKTKDGNTIMGFSNVYVNHVDGKTAEGSKTIEYSDIDYFTVTTCD